jgi:hypothetical protein
MKFIIPFLMFVFLFGAQPVSAHGDHNHGPISADAAMTLAAEVCANLSTRDVGLGFGQLPVSWASIPSQNTAIYKDDKDYYIVSVLNNTEQKMLFVLMSNGGEIYDVNFSGVFSQIKK